MPELLISVSPSRRTNCKSVRLVWKRTAPLMCPMWVVPKNSPARLTGPVMSERVTSWAWPWMVMPLPMLCAEMDEPLLLMWAVAAPVMAESSMSPWLAVATTGALMDAMWMSPWSAVTLTGTDAGTVSTSSALAPSIDGMVTVHAEFWYLLSGLKCCAFASASASELAYASLWMARCMALSSLVPLTVTLP